MCVCPWLYFQWPFSLPNISLGVCVSYPLLIAPLPPGSGFRTAGHSSCWRAENWLGQTCIETRVGKKELRSHLISFRQTRQNDEGGELLSPGMVFSLFHGKDTISCWSLGFFVCSPHGFCSKGVKGSAGSSNKCHFYSLHMEHDVVSCVVDCRAWKFWNF